MMQGSEAPAVEGSAGRGPRAARKPRVNYLELLNAIRENNNPNPDTPAGGQRKRSTSAAATVAAAATVQLPQPEAATAAPNAQAVEAEAGARPAERKCTASSAVQAAVQQECEQQAQAADAGPASMARAAVTAAVAAAAGSPEQQQQPGKQRYKRQRVLVDVHRGSNRAQAEPEEVENAYERQRLERIKRNEEMLRQLGLQEAASGLAAAMAAGQAPAGQAPAGGGSSRGPPRPRERRPALPTAQCPARTSARQRGDRALAPEEAVAQAASELGAVGVAVPSDATDRELEHGALLEAEQYFKLSGQDISGAVRTDGRFRGWVSPAVCERYGIAQDPDAAWEAGHGGKFSFKIDKNAIPSNLKGRGWSDARAFSHTQLQKNPNSYFYRHVVPHEQQAQGEWTEEEHQAFVETARQHGVGDKWGLFASYLPQRVGYQCSAYYRDVIVPQGLVIDRRYKMTRNGKAVFVG